MSVSRGCFGVLMARPSLSISYGLHLSTFEVFSGITQVVPGSNNSKCQLNSSTSYGGKALVDGSACGDHGGDLFLTAATRRRHRGWRCYRGGGGFSICGGHAEERAGQEAKLDGPGRRRQSEPAPRVRTAWSVETESGVTKNGTTITRT